MVVRKHGIFNGAGPVSLDRFYRLNDSQAFSQKDSLKLFQEAQLGVDLNPEEIWLIASSWAGMCSQKLLRGMMNVGEGE